MQVILIPALRFDIATADDGKGEDIPRADPVAQLGQQAVCVGKLTLPVGLDDEFRPDLLALALGASALALAACGGRLWRYPREP